jgi:hypothetical protein
MSPVELLTARWREDADHYEQDGVPGHAALLRRVAAELERVGMAGQGEPLTVEAAARESGYSVSQIRRLLSSGAADNVGDAQGPRIRRGDLPRKAGQLTAKERARAAERRLRIS